MYREKEFDELLDQILSADSNLLKQWIEELQEQIDSRKQLKEHLIKDVRKNRKKLALFLITLSTGQKVTNLPLMQDGRA